MYVVFREVHRNLCLRCSRNVKLKRWISRTPCTCLDKQRSLLQICFDIRKCFCPLIERNIFPRMKSFPKYCDTLDEYQFLSTTILDTNLLRTTVQYDNSKVYNFRNCSQSTNKTYFDPIKIPMNKMRERKDSYIFVPLLI